VLLDNLEHVIGAASSLASLLAACPNLTLLVTSRELLRIQGEVELSVPPLEEQEAVDLFCKRSGMEPADEIAELCRRLDSLPLAVELAAARTRALAPAQILQRVAQRLDLLKGGRDADPRQQTLRATIEWSFDLLTPDELRLMRRLSVFAGGCTLDAAESVADADVDTLQSLVEKSLIRFAGGRYLVLETIRELAAEGLEADDADEVRLRHRAFFVALGQDGAQRLHTVEEAAESARLEPEHPNLRAAVAYALAACEPDDVGYIVGAVYPFLISHGHLAETTEWVDAALRLRDRLSEAALADLLAGGSEIARFAGDLDLAIALKNELVEVDAAPQRPNSRAATLADLAEIWVDCGDFAQARRYAQLSRDAGHGVRASLAFAEIALREGDLPEVEREAGAALAQLDEGSFNHACALEIAGEAARRAGDDVIAVDRFAAGLRSFAGLGDGGGTADCLEGLARLAASAGDEVRAGTLLGSAERLREVWGRRPIRADVPPPAVPSAARQAGRALTLDEAVEEALG
jgi:predicted ATPase